MLAKIKNIILGEYRGAILKGIYKVHEIKYSAVVSVGLCWGVSASVCPGGDVVEAKESCVEGRGGVRALQESLHFIGQPVPHSRYFFGAGATGVDVNGVHMKNDSLVKKDEYSSPVGTRGVSGDAKYRAVEWMAVFQPVLILMLHRGVVEGDLVVAKTI